MSFSDYATKFDSPLKAQTLIQKYQPQELEQFERASALDKSDTLTTILAPIFLIIALGLTIHYALHPVSPMIRMTADFSMSLPLIICSGAGFIFAVTLVVQIIRRKKIKAAFERSITQLIHDSPLFKRQIRKIIHPGARKGNQSVDHYRKARKNEIKIAEEIGSIVSFKTRDGVNLGGFWYRNTNKEAPTAIIFHGNNMQAEDMLEWGREYKNLGFNVLLAEYRGYGISEGQACTENQEIEAYLDAEAALKFVLGQGVDKSKILAHGFSLGGLYATALGYFFGIRHVILDHTFPSLAAVIHNATPFSLGLAGRVVDASYGRKTMPKDPEIPDSKDLVTDRFNSLAKVKAMDAEIFVIRGEEDKLMHLKFGEEFVQAKYSDPIIQQSRLVTIAGGHCEIQYFFKDSSAKEKFNAYLLVQGLLSSV